MNLRSLDLNLLPVFEAIYSERNLTRASEALHVTQPAVSNALARLRAHFGDQLFVRAGRGVAPTSMADALIRPIRTALGELRDGLQQTERFDPGTSSRVFNVAVRDMGAFVLAPAMGKILSGHAPGVRLHWRQSERRDIQTDLASGRLDFAVDVPGIPGPEMEGIPLMHAPYVLVLRRNHPMAQAKLNVEAFLRLRHISVSSRREGGNAIDEALRRLGHRLNPVSRMAHFQAAFRLVASSDYALVAPRAIAIAHDVVVRKLPFAAPPLVLHLYWRREAGDDPGLRWLKRSLIAASARLTVKA